MFKMKRHISKLILISSILTLSLNALGSNHNDGKNYGHHKINCDSPQNFLIELGCAAGIKAANNIPLIPTSLDFPSGGIQNLSPTEKEIFRKGFTAGIGTSLGDHTGWKLGLAAATPIAPALGYRNPIYGELLERMIIVGNNVNIKPDYALGTAVEADLLFVVKNKAINFAKTPADILKNVEGVYPAIELPAAFTPTFVPYAYGPTLGGEGILEVNNIAARLFVRDKKLIKIPGARSLNNWETILNGGLQATDLLVRSPTNVGQSAAAVPHLTNMIKMIGMMRAMGLELRPGDLVSPGTAVATRLTNGTEQSFTVTYQNLDPNKVIQINVNYTADGLTISPDCDK